MNSGIVVWPLDTHLAALTVAYSIIKCASLFAALCWHGSILTEGQISAEPKYATIDWQCWVRYGSWSQCPHCGSLIYNDQYFQDYIYQIRATTGKPCPMSVHRGASPSEPLVHAHGHVGVSSRWCASLRVWTVWKSWNPDLAIPFATRAKNIRRAIYSAKLYGDWNLRCWYREQ